MNTTAVYSTTTLRPFPRISGFWSIMPSKYIKIFSVLISTTLSISSIFCVLSLIILIGCKRHKSLAKKNITSVIATLLLFDIILFCELCNWNLDYAGCYTAAVISHWTELSMNLWLNVLSADIWRASFKIESHDTLRENNQAKCFVFYSLYACGLSAVYVAISVIIDHLDSIQVQYKPNYVEEKHRKCWSTSLNYVISHVIYSTGPCMLCAILSLIFLLLTYINIRKTSNLVENVFRRRVKKRFMLYVNVSAFRDISLVVGYIPLWNTGYVVVTLISFAFNTLLGFYLFVLFVFNKKKLKLVVSKWVRSVRSNSVNNNGR